MIGRVRAKNKVHAKRLVEIAAIGATKAKKVPRARSEVRPRGGQKRENQRFQERNIILQVE